MRALDFSPFEFRLKTEEESVDATIFKLRPLSGMELLELSDIVDQGSKRATFFSALKYGLLGWSNMQGNDGHVEFSKDMSQNVKVLDVDTITELFNAITARSKVTEEEAKN